VLGETYSEMLTSCVVIDCSTEGDMCASTVPSANSGPNFIHRASASENQRSTHFCHFHIKDEIVKNNKFWEQLIA
jgi:hypothetical protein